LACTLKKEYLRFMRSTFIKAILVLIMGSFFVPAISQVNIKDSVVFSPLIDFSYSYKVPGGDLSKRFGPSSEIGIAFYIKTKKNFLEVMKR